MLTLTTTTTTEVTMFKASTEHEFMQQGSKFSLADSLSANQMVSDFSRVATFL